MPTTDEAEIRAIIADQFAALHDRDPERMLADYATDVVQYTLAPPLQHLGDDVEGVRAWMTGFDGPIERRAQGAGGDGGRATSRSCTASPRCGPPPRAPPGRSSCGRAPRSASGGSTAGGA